MLPAKPWKTDALIRLGASIFVCVITGYLVMAVLHYASSHHHRHAWFFLVSAAAFVCFGLSLLLLHLPWRIERFTIRLAGVLFSFYAGFILFLVALKAAGPPGPSVGQMIGATLSFQGSALLWTALFVREHRISWVEAFGFTTNCVKAILVGIILGSLFLPIGWGLQMGSATLMEWASRKLPHLLLKPEEQQAVQALQMAYSVVHRVVLGVITIVLAPVAEEILFRGILYPFIKRLGFPRLALWGTSLAFAAVHLNLVTFVPLVVLALALTILYERTDNLLAPITAHAVFNGANFTVLYLLQQSKLS